MRNLVPSFNHNPTHDDAKRNAACWIAAGGLMGSSQNRWVFRFGDFGLDRRL
ncbi:hypothetical protein [Rhodopirellula sp. SWK7]|uniref:hypothetical protein n=1 Tax=Rhodopirellula sp. SWK7 TaxID=595460 RepID=UPI00034C2436|nr:hypothetical protein [Rhodopirellula sp. SWK7]